VSSIQATASIAVAGLAVTDHATRPRRARTTAPRATTASATCGMLMPGARDTPKPAILKRDGSFHVRNQESPLFNNNEMPENRS
jgi:hypothetical protein